jgi:hypothetical protein
MPDCLLIAFATHFGLIGKRTVQSTSGIPSPAMHLKYHGSGQTIGRAPLGEAPQHLQTRLGNEHLNLISFSRP